MAKRGPKKKARALKMLAQFECEWVRSRSDLNETQLDIKYARDLETGSKLCVGEIRCVFRHARVRWKPFPEDVLIRLDADPTMAGIGVCARSLFWELLEDPPVTRAQARSLIRRILMRFGLVQTTDSLGGFGGDDDGNAGNSLPIGEEESKRTIRLVERLIADNPYSLDSIALLGALCREAWFCFRADEAAYFGTKFWILLQDFLSQPGMEKLEGTLDEFAVDRIVYWREESRCGQSWLPGGDETLPDCY